ncbi:MAG: Xaa-Pro peptidase family protein [Candidatus Gracilibacteria bacterium]|jgi:Xaa-Pro aminopeptidase
MQKALLITGKSNITYLSNFTGSNGFMFLVGNKHYLFTDFRYIERAKNTIKKNITIIDSTKMWRNPEMLAQNWHRILKKHKVRSIGIEEDHLTISQLKKFQKISKIKGQKITFKNASGNIEKLREIKSKQEIGLITKSQRLNEKVFSLIKKFVQLSLNKKNKITELDLVWKIKEFAHNLGVDELSFEPIIAFGKHSSMPHHLPDKTILKKGDLILVDMGMKYEGYCSDMTRMIFTKPPTKEEKEIYNLVLKAQEFAIKNIKAGIAGRKADSFARNIIKKAGYGETFGHGGGHGIGLDIHESPSLSENSKDKLKENTIITVEPGIYLEGKFGIRIEDMVLVTKSGAKNLTGIGKTLS